MNLSCVWCVVTFIEGRREDGVVDGEQELEEVLPQVVLLQILAVLGDALEQYENGVAHHDVLGRRLRVATRHEQVVQVPEHFARVHDRLVADRLRHERARLIEQHRQPVVVHVPAVLDRVLILVAQRQPIHQVLNNTIYVDIYEVP